MAVLLPSSPALQETPLSPFGTSSTPSSVKQEGGPTDEVEGSDAEASEEEWEDIGEGDDGGSGEGGTGLS